MPAIHDTPPEATLPTERAPELSKNAAPEDRPDCERAALERMRPLWEWPDLLLSGTKGRSEERRVGKEC